MFGYGQTRRIRLEADAAWTDQSGGRLYIMECRLFTCGCSVNRRRQREWLQPMPGLARAPRWGAGNNLEALAVASTDVAWVMAGAGIRPPQAFEVGQRCRDAFVDLGSRRPQAALRPLIARRSLSPLTIFYQSWPGSGPGRPWWCSRISAGGPCARSPTPRVFLNS